MRILLAIGHSDPRIGLELLLSQEPGLNIVGTTSDLESLRALTRTSRPDVVVMDWNLSGRPASELLFEIQRSAGRPYFLIVGRGPELERLALEAGAHSFVAIGDPPEELLKAIRQIRACLFSRKGND